MRIPHTVTENIFQAYRCSAETASLPNELRRTLYSEDQKWDERSPPDLKIFALRAIVSVWKDNPIFEELPTCTDRDILVEMLPTDLPFELTITKIVNDHYWERAAKDRWSHNDPNEHDKSWRRLYCERHLSEYLENLEASYFEPQQDDCMRLVELVKEHVHVLKLRALVPTKKQPEHSTAPGTVQEDIVEHIPMSVILPQLPHLTEISFNVGMIYMNDGFEWRDFEFSVQDCVNLGVGLKACKNLEKFSLTRSNLDRVRAAALLQNLVEHKSLKELDFSHCKLSDSGAHAVAEFTSLYRRLKVLRLTNNDIGAEGVAGIVYALVGRSVVALQHLDLGLNPLCDTGGSHICALLLRNKHIEILNINGCELSSSIGEAIADIFESGDINVPTFQINVSNNDFGPEVGRMFEKIVKFHSNIIGLDVRMCNFTRDSEFSIGQSILRNKQRRAKRRASSSIPRETMLPSLSRLWTSDKYSEEATAIDDDTLTVLTPRLNQHESKSSLFSDETKQNGGD
ncbi:hypothetical protein KPH14_001618 [Odynerus spinipes]|uniref:T-complex-associated testis-expressed protein 1 n=1 Tax=Odynerus spinipes TaxID=1348599 RepID=A0AAD9RZZ0_9HYME|nr:hypothetical protein KPH14_001618 [Odynerus spinipes]